jgi:hypothetical protein
MGSQQTFTSPDYVGRSKGDSMIIPMFMALQVALTAVPDKMEGCTSEGGDRVLAAVTPSAPRLGRSG